MHSAQVLNRTPTHALDWRVPYTLATGGRPDNASLGVFGTRCFSFVPAAERDGKLDARGEEGIYLGFDGDRHGTAEPAHLILRTRTQQIVSSRSVQFDHDAIITASLAVRAFAASDMPHYGGTTPTDPRNHHQARLHHQIS